MRTLRITLVAGAAALALAAAPAKAEFGIQPGSFVASLSTAQAGAHPDLRVNFDFNTLPPDGDGVALPDENVRNVSVDMPAGVIGDATSTPRCTASDFDAGGSGACAPATQVGIAVVGINQFGGQLEELAIPVFNLVPNPGAPAEFGIQLVGFSQRLTVRVRSDGDYGVTTDVRDLEENSPIVYSHLTLWGVPADPSHDNQRCQQPNPNTTEHLCDNYNGQSNSQPQSAGVPRRPFLINPTRCDTPLTATLRVASWQHPSVVKTYDTSLDSITGCDQLRFDPSISIKPTVTQVDSPSGLVVDLKVPQNDDPDGLATADLRDSVVQLPAGMTVSPSSADGLQGCSDDQFALHSTAAATCPDASQIGTLEIHTPLLPDPLLKGQVFIGTPLCDPCSDADAQSGRMFRLFFQAAGSGVRVKLAGTVSADPRTGQLTTTFKDNPQVPFDELTLILKSGPRAPLATPMACGSFTATSDLVPWSAPDSGPGKTLLSSLDFSWDGSGGACPATLPFTPSLSAGLDDAAAGGSSPFKFRLTRDDRNQILSSVTDVHLPAGLLASIKGIPQCPDGQAAAGTCDAASQVGRVTTGAGPGPHPFYVGGKVFLTQGYKGAPFGLSIVVPAVAGPYNLGTVVVRAAIDVDPTTAAVSIRSDSLPTILSGVPLRIRDIMVDMDRPGFMRSPTNCTPSAITANAVSDTGTVAPLSARFQVGGCQDLPFTPAMAMRLTGKGQTTDGKHPSLITTVTSSDGQANLQKARVALPLSLALDPENSTTVCGFDVALAVHGGAVGCPAETIVGHATAVSPLLNDPLSGPVYLVQGLRVNSAGRVVRTLPTLLVPLRGEVALDLRGRSDVVDKKLVTTFPAIPDAAVSSFQLTIDGGPKGILVVTHEQNLCSGKQITETDFVGQSGRAHHQRVDMATPCGEASRVKIRSAKWRGRRLTVSGSIAAGATKRVRVTTRCGKTRMTKTARPRRGAWKAVFSLRGACARARSAMVTASYPGDERLESGTVARAARNAGAARPRRTEKSS